MVYETGLLVGGISIITAMVAKIKCVVNKKRKMEFCLRFLGFPSDRYG